MFEPCLDLRAWVEAHLVGTDAERYGPKPGILNPDHAHLEDATIGYLWARSEQLKSGRRTLGTAALGQRQNSTWSHARRQLQEREWFGHITDFVITLDAAWWLQADDLQRLALLEHELYHCGQARDKHGDLRFRKDGTPVWGIRPHDIEEFHGVVMRYGTAMDDIAEFLKYAEAGPTIGRAELADAGICGSCLRRVA